MKTHLFLKFEFKDSKHMELISTIKLPQPVWGLKSMEVVDFSTRGVLYCFTCDLIKDHYSNCIENLLGVGIGGVGGREVYKAVASGNVRDVTIHMRHIIPKTIYPDRQKWCRAHVVLHSGDLEEYSDAKNMKKTSFMLKLLSDESQTRQSVTFRLPKPLFDCKYVQAINWFASGGYDYITCPQIRATFSNDPVVKEPVLAYGVGGVSKNTEVMELHTPGTLNELQISLIKPGGGKYSLNHSFVHLVVYHA